MKLRNQRLPIVLCACAALFGAAGYAHHTFTSPNPELAELREAVTNARANISEMDVSYTFTAVHDNNPHTITHSKRRIRWLNGLIIVERWHGTSEESLSQPNAYRAVGFELPSNPSLGLQDVHSVLFPDDQWNEPEDRWSRVHREMREREERLGTRPAPLTADEWHKILQKPERTVQHRTFARSFLNNPEIRELYLAADRGDRHAAAQVNHRLMSALKNSRARIIRDDDEAEMFTETFLEEWANNRPPPTLGGATRYVAGTVMATVPTEIVGSVLFGLPETALRKLSGREGDVFDRVAYFFGDQMERAREGAEMIRGVEPAFLTTPWKNAWWIAMVICAALAGTIWAIRGRN